MKNMNLGAYRKAIVALIAAVIVIATELLAAGSTESIIQMTTVLLASGGVWRVFNDQQTNQHDGGNNEL